MLRREVKNDEAAVGAAVENNLAWTWERSEILCQKIIGESCQRTSSIGHHQPLMAALAPDYSLLHFRIPKNIIYQAK